MKKEKNLYYNKVKKYYYNIYDMNNYELNIAECYSLEELIEKVKELTSKTYNKDTLRRMIIDKNIINDRYEIIKDNIEIIDNVKEF